MKKLPVITISREYGSGGHEIGMLLAQKLALPFYDNELIAIASRDSGYAEKAFEAAEQTATNEFAYALSLIGTGGEYRMPLNNQLYMIQSGVIRTLADHGPAVIVGRCADYVLEDYVPTINIFIRADSEAKVARVMQRDKLIRVEAEDRIRRIDKARATYYSFYTNKRWGDRSNYNIMIDSTGLTAEQVADILVSYVSLVTAEE